MPGQGLFGLVNNGKGRVRIEFAPRLDFGRVPTRLLPKADGLVVEGLAAGEKVAYRAVDVDVAR